MRVTVLIENTSDGELKCEHGLSLFIEHDGKQILLDAGSTEAFYDNAALLGVSLENLDACILSHGHYDHSGGFGALFRNDRDFKIYAQKGADKSYYSGSGSMHEIGIPPEILAQKDRFIFIDGHKTLYEGVHLVPHHSPDLEKIGERSKLYKKEGGKIVPDDFAHEQSLVFDLAQGLVIFNSCSHGGAANIIREAKETCGGRPVYAYVGGLHMKGRKCGEDICTFSDAGLDALCRTIRDEKISHVYTGHCTGMPGLKKLKERLGKTAHALTTGMRFEL